MIGVAMGWHRAMSLTFSISLLLLFITSNSILGATHYVSHDGSNVPPYTSWETATPRILFAAQYCQPGDTIRIGSGVYVEPDEVVLECGSSLIGAGADSTERRNKRA